MSIKKIFRDRENRKDVIYTKNNIEKNATRINERNLNYKNHFFSFSLWYTYNLIIFLLFVIQYYFFTNQFFNLYFLELTLYVFNVSFVNFII